MAIIAPRWNNNSLYDTSTPVLLTETEQKLLYDYQNNLENSRTAAEARIYIRKIESLIAMGKRRNIVHHG